MKLTPLLFPACLLLGGTLAAHSIEAFAFSVVDDDFATLNAEFEAAVEKWKEAQGSASKEERRELRKHKPAAAFWERFAALSEKSNGQAKWWMVQHVRAAGIKSSKREETIRPLYDALVKDHKNAEWFADVLPQIAKDRRTLGQDVALGLFETVFTTSESDENRAGALFEAGTLLKKSDDEALQKRGAEYHARITEEFGKTDFAEKVRIAKARENVQVGKMAPDFKGTTIDGFEFSLSDYKGKVVMLDFYGFW